MTTAWSTLLVRYGEIGIKGPAVRARFEKRLQANIEEAFQARGIEAQITRDWGRVFIQTPQPKQALDALAHTFGIVGASQAMELPAQPEAISRAVAQASRQTLKAGQSFAVRARRTGTHAFTSQDVAGETGAAILEANAQRNVRVDLTNPDVLFQIEIRNAAAYLYLESVRGPGGFPVGTQGRVAILLEDARAALAAWLFLKRGASVTLLAMAPLAPETARAAHALRAWVPDVKVQLFDAPGEDAAHARALLLAAAGRLVQLGRAHAVVVGDDADAMADVVAMDALAQAPVFRPLIGYPGELLEDLAREAEVPLAPARAPRSVAPAPDPARVEALLHARRTTSLAELAREAPA